MNKKLKRIISALLAVFIAIVGIVQIGGTASVKAAGKVSYGDPKTYGNEKTGDYGYVYSPNEKGTYPSVIFIHGLGGFKPDEYAPTILSWMTNGYLDPMVVIMPKINPNITDHNGYVTLTGDNEFLGKLINRIENGKLDTDAATIEKGNGYSIAGYSMGGGASLLAGSRYNDVFKNVGGLSPNYHFLMENGTGWITQSPLVSDCNFSEREDGHLFITSGNSGDEQGFYDVSDRCMDKFGFKKGFVRTAFDYSEHKSPLFLQEFFSYLYFIQNDRLPDSDTMKTVFGDGAIPYTVLSDGSSDNPNIPKIDSVKLSLSASLEGSVSVGQDYTIKVNASGDNLRYQWEWCEDGQSYTNSQTTGCTSSTIQLVGKINRPIIYYRCKVSNNSGSVTTDPVVIRLADANENKESSENAPKIDSVKLSLSDSLEGSVSIGQDYTIKVNASGDNLKYQWEWCEDGQSYINSQSTGCNSSTIQLVGKVNRPIIYYRCKVSNNSGSVTTDPVVIRQKIYGTVTINGDQRYEFGLNVKVTDCNASNFSYQWMRDGEPIKGAVYTSYIAKAEDIGHILTCVITDKNGNFPGSISASTEAIKKGYGPAVPKGISSVNCSAKGANDGKITGVTSAMEYATKTNFSDVKKCTGSEVTGLKPGTYYIRLSETDTKYAGGMAEVYIK